MLFLQFRIKTYDPTVDGADKPDNDLISFERLGIGAVTTDSTSVGPVATFKVTLSRAFQQDAII
jgi:hypothetical protein